MRSLSDLVQCDYSPVNLQASICLLFQRLRLMSAGRCRGFAFTMLLIADADGVSRFARGPGTSLYFAANDVLPSSLESILLLSHRVKRFLPIDVFEF